MDDVKVLLLGENCILVPSQSRSINSGEWLERIRILYELIDVFEINATNFRSSLPVFLRLCKWTNV